MSEEISALYRLPLADFTNARNALAKQLASEGHREAADEVKKLKKPNLAAWATNQVVHTDGVDELFEATEALRRAQRKVMSGGKAGELREVTDRRNRIVSELTRRAEAILEEAGHAASSTTMAAISDSFVAVASDDEGVELLRAGRLTRELKPQAVVDVSGLHLVETEAEPEPAEPEEPPADREAVAAARAELTRTQGAAKEAKKAAWDAEREAERLAQLAKEAEQRARSAREEAEFAHRAAEARRTEAEEAEADVERAEAEVRRVR